MSNQDPMGYYEILEISPAASLQEIKNAYRRKAQELHPDKNKGTDTTKQFQLLNEAYQVLKNPGSRARYDAVTIKTKSPETNNQANQTNSHQRKSQKNSWSISWSFIRKPYATYYLTVCFLFVIIYFSSSKDNGHNTYNIPSKSAPAFTAEVISPGMANAGIYESQAYDANKNSQNQHMPIETQPMPGTDNILTINELHYCLAEKIRLNGARSIVNEYNDADIDRFNSMISDYNSRCGSYRYRVGSQVSARHDVDIYLNLYLADGRNRFSKSKKTSESLSSSNVLQQVFTNFNSANGTGFFILRDLPNSPRFQSINDWVGRKINVKLLAKQNFPTNSDRSIYLLSAVPDLKEKFDCHACSPLLYALLTHTDSSGRENIDGSLQPLGQFGSFGKYELSKNEKPSWSTKIGPDLFGDLKFLQLSQKIDGFALSDGNMAQGEKNGYVAIFGLYDFTIAHLADVSILDDARDGLCSENSSALCANYHATIYVVPDKSPTLYPIKVVESGTKWSKDYKASHYTQVEVEYATC